MCSKDIVFARHGTTDIGLDTINVERKKLAVANDNVVILASAVNDNSEGLFRRVAAAA